MKHIFIPFVLIFALAACNGNRNASASEEAKVETVETAIKDTQKPMNSVLNDVYGIRLLNGNKVPSTANMMLEFQLATGKISGEGGCNRFGGTLSLIDEQLKISEVRATRMACADGKRMALETELFKTLPKVDSYKSNRGILVLFSEGMPVIEAGRID